MLYLLLYTPGVQSPSLFQLPSPRRYTDSLYYSNGPFGIFKSMALSLSDIIIILIGVVAIIAIVAAVFLVVYANRRRRLKKSVSLPTEDAFEDEKVDFEAGRRMPSHEWQRHSRTLSDSSDTPLMAHIGPHQWTPSPSRSTFGAEPHNVAPYRDASPEKRSPPSRLQELPQMASAVVANSPLPVLHKKTPSATSQRTLGGIDARPAIIPPPLPTSTQPLKINKSRRTNSMRTNLLTRLASTRRAQHQSTEDDEDVSPKSIYSQSSFAYSSRHASRPGSVYNDLVPPVPEIPSEFRQSENVTATRSSTSEARALAEEMQPRLRDSVVFQFPPAGASESSLALEEVPLSPDAHPKSTTGDASSPVTLYAETEAPVESPADETQWRSLRSKLLSTIQDHVIVSENGTQTYQSVSRFPSLKY